MDRATCNILKIYFEKFGDWNGYLRRHGDENERERKEERETEREREIETERESERDRE